MLYILDRKQRTVGVASNSAPLALPYYEDLHTENLEGINTYEFKVPSQHEQSGLLVTNGHIILKDLDGRFLLFTIKSIDEGWQEGRLLKTVHCESTAITELLGDVVRPMLLKGSSLENTVREVMSVSINWTVGDIDFSTYKIDFEIKDHMTLLEALRKIESDYSVEIYFDVVLDGTKIVEKRVNVVQQRGRNTGVRFDYSYNITGVGRIEDSTRIVTALIGLGKGDTDAERLSLKSVPAFDDGDFYKADGADWIGSDKALDIWSTNGKHIFGIFVDESATTADQLKKNTINELKNRSTPYVTYSASVVTLERLTGYDGQKLRIGDTIVVKDNSFTPAIAITARIKEVKRSYTRIDNDSVDLGNYKPITLSPNNELRKLQNVISKNEEKWNTTAITMYIESLKGTVFRNGEGSTVLTARVFNHDEEIDADGANLIYKWYKYTPEGDSVPLWGGTTDYRTGKKQTVSTADFEGQATFKVIIDDGK
ncbi:phage tail spike protein [Bacillus cereus group sp. MYBK215-1]|uniref:phage tail spike protein n=1 Tax=unclassified Bacillus cereus group TaxID=2750818 RepID=UPI003F7A1B24